MTLPALWLAKKESVAIARLSSSAEAPISSPTGPLSDRNSGLLAGANEVTGAGALGAAGVPARDPSFHETINRTARRTVAPVREIRVEAGSGARIFSPSFPICC